MPFNAGYGMLIHTKSRRTKIAKRPARAKAFIINAFALAGRIGICDTFTQGGALGYVLLPSSGRVAVTFEAPSFLFNIRKSLL